MNLNYHIVMKAFRYIICICLISVGLTSCGKDEVKEQDIDFKNNVKKVTATVTNFGAITRSELYRENNEIKFRWTLNDTLGIFPDKGSQAYFTIDNGQDGGSTASFNGGGWALKSNHTYSAYFPFINNIFLESDNIPLDYTGQEQTGNNSYDHLWKYDYLASDAITPTSDNLVFLMKHIGSILNVKLTVNEPGVYTSCKFTANEEVFITNAVLDMSASTPVVKPIEKANSIELQLNDIIIHETREELILSMMVYTVDLFSEPLNVSLYRSDGYVESMIIDSSNIITSEPIINWIAFVDKEVETICIDNWDSDGDGRLSYDEAAAVTDIGEAFKESNISSFKEFKYFTGITEIPDNAFFLCEQLTTIDLPNSILSIGNRAFEQCSSLTHVSMPSSLLIINKRAFCGCGSLNSIYIPEGVTMIQDQAFESCGLVSIVLPKSVTEIRYGAFGCRNLEHAIILNPHMDIKSNYIFDSNAIKRIEVPAESVDYYKSVLIFYSDKIFALDCDESDDNNGDNGEDNNGDNGGDNGNDNNTDISAVISFIDSTVKSICVSNWDTNGDGELSLAEAATVNSIGTVFKGKSIKYFDELKNFTGIGSIPNNAFDGYGGVKTLVSIVLPESIVSIGEYAFRQQTSLNSIIIPQNVTSLGMQAFAGCAALKTIYFKSATPPTYGSDAIPDVIQRIYVPAGSVDSYKAAFSKFANRIMAGDY